jgi:hypothetical protein
MSVDSKSSVVNFQRISLKSCQKMLCSSYVLPTKYEQPIRTSANTITFSVCTLQAESKIENIGQIDFQRISLKSCQKMLCSSYDLPTKYEQPIRTSANTITFSVCTLQAE